ncbi:MAG: hypothetical protein KAK00_01340 [Nanoarchaeota archaeon]|nr:hypothetical protein [Nanoarchaeota archaeon]
MNIEEVFSNSKWDIIKDLSEKKFSPLQLAHKYNTTIGNVGHQLRLLEAYGLVKKEKIINRDKGKPRSLFSLAYDCGYIVSATSGFAEKKFLKLSDYHNTILKMWFIEDTRLHYYLEKFYWKIEEHLRDIKGIAVKVADSSSIEITILTNLKKDIMKKINPKMLIKNMESDEITFNIKFLNEDDLKRFDSIRECYIIYDPNEVLSCYKKSFKL